MKKTKCPSTLRMRVYSSLALAIANHPSKACLIDMQYSHNHPVKSAHELSFRPVANCAKEKYNNLFESGYSAARARDEYVNRLQLKFGTSDVEVALANRSINPNCQDVQRLFQKWRQKCVGLENGKLMFERLSLEVNQFNKAHSSENGRALLQLYQSAEETKEAVAPEHSPKVKKSRSQCSIPFSSCHTLNDESSQTVVPKQ